MRVDDRLDSVGIRSCALALEELPGTIEGRFEARSVEYAISQNELEPPVCTLGGGSGSVQVSGADLSFSFEAFLDKGERLIDMSKPSPANVAKWQQAITVEWHMNPSPLKHMLLSLAMRAGEGPGEKLRIVAIGAFYHAAVAAGVVKRYETPKYLSAVVVRKKLIELCANTAVTAIKDVRATLMPLVRLPTQGCLPRQSCVWARR